MNAPTLSRIWDHRGSSFGSKTTHLSPALRLCSRYSAVRRTGTYFHSLDRVSAPNRVRAPHPTLPITGRVRTALMPSGLSEPLSPSVTGTARATPLTTASMPAGAFHTPRVASVRAITPATTPLGPTFFDRPGARGSGMTSRG